MKKAITILLAAALMLSLAACGSGNDSNNKPIGGDNTNLDSEATEMTKDEMLEVAEKIDIKDLDDVAGAYSPNENKARAETTYSGNVYMLSAIVENIESDYVSLVSGANMGFSLHVYLEKDDLAAIDVDEKITVVGRIGELGVEEVLVGEAAFEIPYFKMDNTYLIDESQ